jgi:pimeloyl-ACP methyl ester carboxylesterase
MPFAVKIYYQIHQDAADLPLVLLHGAGGNHLSWPPELRRLAGFRVYALDLPGHGKSPGRGQQSIEAYLIALRDWMQAVELHRAVFIGH